MANETPKPFPPLLTFEFQTAQIRFFTPLPPLQTFKFQTAQFRVFSPLQDWIYETAQVKVSDGKLEIVKESQQGKFYAEDLTHPLSQEKNIFLDLVQIGGGTFRMGDDTLYSNKKPIYPDAIPCSNINVPKFFLGKYAVTQKQWRVISALPSIDRGIDPDPSAFKGDDRPVEQVSWLDVMEFCKRLSYLTGKNYRLPSEAEWEYACRADTTTVFNFDPTNKINQWEFGLIKDPSEINRIKEKITELTNINLEGKMYPGETKTVGLYPANSFGLYDMHGNVWEWCKDSWHDNYLNAPAKDGRAWGGNSSRRVIRGGAWNYLSRFSHSASRNFCEEYNSSYSVGFRVACSV